jgi:hypothetical protein
MTEEIYVASGLIFVLVGYNTIGRQSNIPSVLKKYGSKNCLLSKTDVMWIQFHEFSALT